jgi:glutamate-5-semialdehyde dehydrogenase
MATTAQQLHPIDDVQAYMLELGIAARKASGVMARASSDTKNAALNAIADAIESSADEISGANRLDLEMSRQTGLSSALLDRLELTPARISGMATGLRQIIALPDPVGAISQMNTRPSGLQIGRMRVPLGVIGIIYESRPNVTVDAAALCLKSGNVAILRGGSEAQHSNRAIANCIETGLKAAGLPKSTVQVVATTDRQAVGSLITMREYVDIIIPRGGKSLIQRISDDARVPVIKHLEGICHVFVDRHADIDMALAIALNAKTYRYGICGAMETLLVDAQIAEQFLPEMARQFHDAGVEMRGCESSCALVGEMQSATEEDWHTEYLGPIVSIRIVADIQSAMDHIRDYGSQHTDAIVTEHLANSRRFTAEVDSSSVMVNTPTCFADGFVYGLGAEIGISTDKLHVRGPVGLEGLTTEKYVVISDGQIRT